ncbi:MAG: NAD(P)H-dependent glycerol-3-phosphate dehydrogenase [Leptolyngbyaceae cyanobacterium bins.302]|nr:NAD(P)H-dependent glycerol-3-phosphate dehydrogenase [Leptolyngbyaceae cyanobacterium bins.302]
MSSANPASTSPITKIALIGAGAWGSTLATLATRRGHTVQVWSRRSTTSLQSVLDGAEIVISAVSMKGVRSVVEHVQSLSLPSTAIVISATKGLDASSGSATQLPLLPSQIWQSALPHHRVVVLSGPNLAEEIQQGLPAATVIAGNDSTATNTIQLALSSNHFRVYTNPDLLGVELGGILKNVIAIAVGACDGLQLGTNAKAALVTRGLTEIIRVGSYWGAKPDTFYGLAGLGDLLATCNSPLSRNYRVGYGLAQGKSLATVLASLAGTAEGVNTADVLVRLAEQQHIAVPISHQVYQLLQGNITPQAAVAALMLRDYKAEVS